VLRHRRRVKRDSMHHFTRYSSFQRALLDAASRIDLPLEEVLVLVRRIVVGINSTLKPPESPAASAYIGFAVVAGFFAVVVARDLPVCWDLKLLLLESLLGPGWGMRGMPP
jgi:hypothetical protein